MRMSSSWSLSCAGRRARRFRWRRPSGWRRCVLVRASKGSSRASNAAAPSVWAMVRARTAELSRARSCTSVLKARYSCHSLAKASTRTLPSSEESSRNWARFWSIPAASVAMASANVLHLLFGGGEHEILLVTGNAQGARIGVGGNGDALHIAVHGRIEGGVEAAQILNGDEHAAGREERRRPRRSPPVWP